MRYYGLQHTCVSCKITLAESLKIITNIFDVFNILRGFLVISQKKIPLQKTKEVNDNISFWTNRLQIYY